MFSFVQLRELFQFSKDRILQLCALKIREVATPKLRAHLSDHAFEELAQDWTSHVYEELVQITRRRIRISRECEETSLRQSDWMLLSNLGPVILKEYILLKKET